MNFIKRAGITLWTQKGRTILLTIVSSVILVFVMAGLIIQNAAQSSAKIAADAVGSTVTLSANREKMFEQMRKQSTDSDSTSDTTIQTPTTTVAKVQKMAALSNVSSYNITNSTSVNANSFKAISTSKKQGQMLGGMSQTSSGDISISGTLTTAGVSGFQDKTSKITSGRGIKASDVNTKNIIVETELALANGIKVGDHLKVANSDDSSKTTSLKVVGIYQSKATDSGPMGAGAGNTIYGSYTLVNSLAGTENEVANVTFNMQEPAKTKQFVQAAKKILNDNKITLTSDASAYKLAAKNMRRVASLAGQIVWVVAIAGALILGLIILLLTRERRREIGILVSLGETKSKVVSQLFVELLMILVVALGIATAVGTTVSNQVGKSLVSQQQTSQTQQRMGGAPGGGQAPSKGSATNGQPSGDHQPGAGMEQSFSQSSKTVKLNNVMTPITVLELGGIAILIALLSVGGGAIMILKLQPKQILQVD
ncbi:ABC transporter permease [Weissella coleopterorum]|uniref:ABC transporter permease n=1 Tax=Weissella coleopterorum TaxID=2714949 RepID=A0A6G8AYU9_9LACO|nr:ABC transporter permease [Weissella coleopterorum]QIL50167.1 ABC transporter permease [Weissella coleopterorum]